MIRWNLGSGVLRVLPIVLVTVSMMVSAQLSEMNMRTYPVIAIRMPIPMRVLKRIAQSEEWDDQ